MSKYKIIDTNVLIAANGRETHADLKCQLSCMEAIESVVLKDIVLLDNLGLILDEYSTYCSYKGDPGVGDAFFKHIFDNQSVQSKCLVFKITRDPYEENNFIEFPNSPDLVKFDPSDRKFIAVSVSSKLDPHIYNATDSDWELFKPALQKEKIVVIQLCPQHATKD